MVKNWYVRFSDSKKSEKVSFEEFVELRKMAEFYGSLVSNNFCPCGKVLTVSFPKHFV